MDQDEWWIEFNKEELVIRVGNLIITLQWDIRMEETQKSLGMGKMVASKLASLVFNEGVD